MDVILCVNCPPFHNWDFNYPFYAKCGTNSSKKGVFVSIPKDKERSWGNFDDVFLSSFWDIGLKVKNKQHLLI